MMMDNQAIDGMFENDNNPGPSSPKPVKPPRSKSGNQNITPIDGESNIYN
jgi:hypothetical protein